MSKLRHTFIVGFGLAMFVTMLLLVVGNVVFADETVATYPARLGEQDRSLGTWVTEYNDDEFLRDLANTDAPPSTTTKRKFDTYEKVLAEVLRQEAEIKKQQEARECDCEDQE